MGIQRIETATDDEKFIRYNVIHEDSSNGCAELSVRTLDEDFIRNAVRNENILPETLVGYLQNFYPHSETSPRRRGTGSQTLDFIIEDARRRGIRLLHAEVTNDIAWRFFLKNGFKGSYPTAYLFIS